MSSMVSVTAAVSGGRSFAAQMAARVLPLSFAMSQRRVSLSMCRSVRDTPSLFCFSPGSADRICRSVTGVCAALSPSAVTVRVRPRSPAVWVWTLSRGYRQASGLGILHHDIFRQPLV